MNVYACPTPYQEDSAAGFYVFMGRQLDGQLTTDEGPVVTFDDGRMTPPVPPPVPGEGRSGDTGSPPLGDREYSGG